MNEYLEKKDFDAQMNAIDQRFEHIDRRFEHIDRRFEHLETRFDKLETRIGGLESGVIRLETEFKTEMKHMATKAWVLGGLAGGMGIAATIAAVFVKLFAV